MNKTDRGEIWQQLAFRDIGYFTCIDLVVFQNNYKIKLHYPLSWVPLSWNKDNSSTLMSLRIYIFFLFSRQILLYMILVFTYFSFQLISTNFLNNLLYAQLSKLSILIRNRCVR